MDNEPLRSQEAAAIDVLPKALEEVERMRKVATRVQQALLRGDIARGRNLITELLNGAPRG